MKRLLSILLLTFGLAFSASGQDYKSKSVLMNTNQEYAFALWIEMCKANYPTPLDLASKSSLVVVEMEHSAALSEQCRGSIASLCLDAMKAWVDDSLSIIDELLTSLKTSPPQCSSIDSFFDQRLIATEHLNAELQSILLSDD